MTQLPIRNFLLANLPPRELAILEPDLEPITAQLREVLSEADEPLEYAYFPTVGQRT